MGAFWLYLIFGYLVGSISPGYFFGKIIKGIDIRDYRYHNTGATNTFYLVGPVFGIITAGFDFLKSLFAYFVAVSVLGPDLAILVGLAAIAGHIFPFYLGFKGGKGVASLLGLASVVLFYTRSIFTLLLAVGIIAYSLKISKRVKFDAPIRKLLKLAALGLPIAFIWFPKQILIVSGILLAGFLAFDVLRFLFPRLNRVYLNSKKIAKEKEKKRLSGYTLFSISMFLVFWLFPKEIAVMSLVFFILGDVFATFSAASLFLPQKSIFKDKTLAGLLIILGISLPAGLFLDSLTPLILSFNFILLGVFLTAVLDLFSFVVDDNILVPLGTALILKLLITSLA